MRRGRAPSSEMRDLARVKAAELGPDSLDPSAKSFARVGARCWRVDFLRPKGRRCGDLTEGLGQVEKTEVLSRSFSLSPVEVGVSLAAPSWVCSNTLKSFPKARVPCTLLRFTRGLPMPAASRFMTPSLLFKGLDFGGLPCSLNTGWSRVSARGLVGTSFLVNSVKSG